MPESDVKVRSIISLADEFEALKESTTSAIRGIFPIVGKSGKSVHLDAVRVEDDKAVNDLRSQLEARLNEKTWGVPVVAKISLRDPSGKVLDRQEVRLAQLPKPTRRLSYIVNGQEYQVDRQWRLKPGVYARVKDNGEIEAHVNTAGGDRMSIEFDPTKRKFSLVHGGATFPLFPVLRALGTDSEDIRRAWGSEVLNANAIADQDKVLKKLYRVDTGKDPKDIGEAIRHVQESFRSKALDPEVTKVTLGKPVDRLDHNALLLASKKLLSVARGDAPPDERDSLLFKNLYSTEDFIGEKIKAFGAPIRRRLSNVVDRENRLERLVYPGLLDKAVSSTFTDSVVAHVPTQDNPIEFLKGHTKTTPLGQGGISDPRMITDEMKGVTPSSFAYIDPVDTPEGTSVGIPGFLTLGVSKGGNDVYTPVYDLKLKKLRPVKPSEFLNAVVALPDYVKWTGPSNKPVPVPVSKTVRALGPGNKFMEVPFSKVDFVVPTPVSVLGAATNMIPFVQNDDGARLGMAARHLAQAVPLKYREQPLVQPKVETGVSPIELPGALASHTSPVDGTVTRISRGAIYIRDSKGKTHEVQIYDYFPLNDKKSGIHAEPIVKVGDRVKAGQVIADTTFTRDGKLALGVNLRAAYIPIPGKTFEDGIVISESAAQKLTSTHLHRHYLEPDEHTRTGKGAFVAYYPNRYTAEQLSKLDEDGVVREGQIVKPGDPLSLSLRKQLVGTEAKMMARLSRSLVKPYVDTSTTWNSEFEGRVVRVHKTPDGKAKVFVATEEPAQIADKLCYDGETEVLTRKGWKKFSDLTLTDEIASLSSSGQLQYHEPLKLHAYPHQGKMYWILSSGVDLLVTLDHNMYVRRAGQGVFGLEKARDIIGAEVEYAKGASWSGLEESGFSIPGCSVPVPMDVWLEFLGYYLAGGVTGAGKPYRISINWSGAYVDLRGRIEKVIAGLGREAAKTPKIVHFWDEPIWNYLDSLKRAIPRFIGDLSPRQIRIFLTSYQSLAKALRRTEPGRFPPLPLEEAGYLQELLLKAGSAGDICSVEKGQKYVVQIAYELTPAVNSGRCGQVVEEIVNYTGMVYCCEVPGHVLYVRRGGKAVWSGNSGIHGNKGIIVEIRPDDQMPKTKDGKPIEIALNPYGAIARMNLGQVYEVAAGKIAQATGKPYQVKNFEPGTDYSEKMRKEMAKYGIPDQEEVIDPTTGKSIGKVMVGPAYIIKQRHQAEKKLSARGMGPGFAYDADRQPKGHGPSGAQALGGLGNLALLAHGARNILREATTYKADFAQQDELWRSIQIGQPIPPPKPTFAQSKFEHYLFTLGVKLKKDGTRIQMVPTRDDEVLKVSHGEITKPNLVLRGHDLAPEPGGLFDPNVTGGIDGTKMGHIKLPEPVPNPFFERGVLALTGLTKTDLLDVLAGKKAISGKELVKPGTPGSLTGSQAIQNMLRSINVDAEIRNLRNQLPNLTGQPLDRANKKLRYLEALKENKLRPDVAYMTQVVPVLPPNMRPIVPLPTGDLATDPLNETYKALGLAVNSLKNADPSLPERSKGRLRKEVYTSLAALQGIGAGYKRVQGGETQGIMDIFTQPTAKLAWVQTKLFKQRQDLSGRSVIVPDPDLNMDEIVVPHRIATEIFKPFTVRELTRAGYSPLEAQQLIKKNDPVAEAALQRVVEERPVLMKRDPVLHKYGIQAFKARIGKGYAIKIPPLVTGGFNADFDGDTTSLFVPVTPAAVADARKMMPSANLLNPVTGKPMYAPSNEMSLGLYRMSKITDDSKAKTFHTVEEALAAHARGDVGWETVKIGGKPTTIGRLRLYASLPMGVRDDRILYDRDYVLDSKRVTEILKNVALKDPKSYADVAQKMVELGSKHSYETGFSLGLSDFVPDKESREKAFAWARSQVAKIPQNLPKKEREERFLNTWMSAVEKMDQAHWEKLKKNPTRLGEMVLAGVKPTKTQYNQLVLSPILLTTVKGKIIPVPQSRSYSEGVDTGDYFVHGMAGRATMVTKTQEVSGPGYLNKQLVNTVADMVVTKKDCGTTDGVSISVDHPDAVGRYLARPTAGLPAKTLLGTKEIDHLRKKGVQSVVVRSPLKCRLPQGLCSTCYGVGPEGSPPDIGTNIGVLSGQAIGERSTQLFLKQFHTGGAAQKGGGEAAVSQFDRVDQVLRLPQHIPNAAVLAEVTGKVKRLRPDPAGGYRVQIVSKNNKEVEHHIPGTQSLRPEVKPGSTISAGTPLSTGLINMHDLLRVTNLDQVQNQITNELDDVYRPSGIRRRNIEVAVRGVTNLGMVEDPGSHPGLRRGDYIPISAAESFNDKKPEKPIKVKPILKGIGFAPLDLHEEWLAKLHHERLKDTLVDAALEGHKSNISGLNPFSALAFNPYFGMGISGIPGAY